RSPTLGSCRSKASATSTRRPRRGTNSSQSSWSTRERIGARRRRRAIDALIRSRGVYIHRSTPLAPAHLPPAGTRPRIIDFVRVIVVGGGIGGLSAAAGLRGTGHEVVVLERAPRIDPVGAGITLFANAMRALARLGVRGAVAARGATARHSAILTSAGRELARVPPDLLEGTVAIRRADLQAVLADAAGEVRLG